MPRPALAEIVHDRFHISKHLNEAVDQVRRVEHKSLMKQGDDTLKGTRSLWLYNLEHFSQEKRAEFEFLKDAQLKTSRARAIREQFRWFRECRGVLRGLVQLRLSLSTQADSARGEDDSQAD